MPSSRRIFRIVVLAVVGASLTACHFHRHGCRGFLFRPPLVRVCR